MSLYSRLCRPELFIIAGPCVAESEYLCLQVAERIAEISLKTGIPFIFKASYTKANRTSKGSFRGPGRDEGLAILRTVKETFELPIVTDIHSAEEAEPAASVADILQIPAFLCRQSDLLEAAGATGKIVNIKKGQFMAPEDMQYSLAKTGAPNLLTERGTFFGYHRLVVDFAGIHTLRSLGVPVIFDATHSVQLPSGANGKSGGNRDLALPLARAALCQGVTGLFFEVHPDPEAALCDGPNSLYLDVFEKEVPRLKELFAFNNQA